MDEPIRILHVFGSLNKGGAESRVMDIYRAIDRNRIQFDFMVHRKERGYFEPEIESLGGYVYHEVPRFRVFNLISYTKAWALFKKKQEYACIHIHLINVAAPVLCIAKKYGVKMRVCHARVSNDIDFPRRLVTFITRLWINKLATNKLAVSDIAGKFAFGAGYFSVVKNAVRLESFRYNVIIRSEVRRALGAENAFVLGHVGRLQKVKNHMFILDVFSGVLNRIPESRLILVGDGELRHEIENRIAQMNLSDKVILLGVRDDIPSLLQSFDLFIIPSLFEGLPGVALEAQASGLPCLLSDTITTEAGVINELVSYLPINKGAGLWVEKIIQIAENLPRRKDTYEEMRAAGFDIGEVAGWYEKFYLNFPSGIDMEKQVLT